MHQRMAKGLNAGRREDPAWLTPCLLHVPCMSTPSANNGCYQPSSLSLLKVRGRVQGMYQRMAKGLKAGRRKDPAGLNHCLLHLPCRPTPSAKDGCYQPSSQSLLKVRGRVQGMHQRMAKGLKAGRRKDPAGLTHCLLHVPCRPTPSAKDGCYQPSSHSLLKGSGRVQGMHQRMAKGLKAGWREDPGLTPCLLHVPCRSTPSAKDGCYQPSSHSLLTVRGRVQGMHQHMEKGLNAGRRDDATPSRSSLASFRSCFPSALSSGYYICLVMYGAIGGLMCA
jgi:hypothetical protein